MSKAENDRIMNLFSIILNQNTHGNRDMINLFNVLGQDVELFSKVVTLFDGRRVRFPEKSEIEESMVLALIYHYRYEEKMEWDAIRKIIPFDFSPMEYAMKIKGLNKFISKQLEDTE